MSVLTLDGETLNSVGLTATDLCVLTALSYKLSAEGLAGACVPAVMDDGQRLVANAIKDAGIGLVHKFLTGLSYLQFGYLGLLEQRIGPDWALELWLPSVCSNA